MANEVRIEQRGSCPLAVVRRLASRQEFPKIIPEACGIVWGVVRSQHIAGAGRHVAVYLDCAFHLEIGVELESPFAGHGEVVGSATPAGLVAGATHYGPYGQLHLAHTAIHEWCRNNGYDLAGPSWEIYGHWQDDWDRDPSKICTEVCYLVVPSGNSRPEPAAATTDGEVAPVL